MTDFVFSRDSNCRILACRAAEGAILLGEEVGSECVERKRVAHKHGLPHWDKQHNCDCEVTANNSQPSTPFNFFLLSFMLSTDRN